MSIQNPVSCVEGAWGGSDFEDYVTFTIFVSK